MASSAYWLVKQEPEEFSWADLEREGRVVWDGVRNYQARNNLRAMQVGDWVLFYHSVTEKRIMGCCRVARAAFPDPTAPEAERDRWSAVELVPEAAFPQPVPLARIKTEPALAELPLLRQSRLSVMPLSQLEFKTLCHLGGWELTGG